jgi:hypothetical protein
MCRKDVNMYKKVALLVLAWLALLVSGVPLYFIIMIYVGVFLIFLAKEITHAND